MTTFTHSPPGPLDTIGPAGRIGLVALGSDLTGEADLRRMTPEGVEIFTTRIRNRNPTTVENLRAMAPDLTRAAASILPGVTVDVLIYLCTSGAVVIGEDEVARLLRAGRPDLPAVQCTNPITAAFEALQHHGAKRISILTPYIESVNREMADFFQSRGVQVLNVHGMGIADDTDMAAVSVASIECAAAAACRDDADLLFISCTALRAAQAIPRIQSRLNKPVISSNQAVMRHALRFLTPPLIKGAGGFTIPALDVN